MARRKRYKVGDQVVYPQHGVATIQKIEDKEVLGEKQSYLVLELDEGDLTLMVPAASVEEVGIRNLSIRDKQKGLSTGERRMLNRARRILAGEIAVALKLDAEGADEVLENALS